MPKSSYQNAFYTVYSMQLLKPCCLCLLDRNFEKYVVSLSPNLVLIIIIQRKKNIFLTFFLNMAKKQRKQLRISLPLTIHRGYYKNELEIKYSIYPFASVYIVFTCKRELLNSFVINLFICKDYLLFMIICAFFRSSCYWW